jgi:4-amino-4-deoxy-L-arabinose transferase-like glycosyltransferase
MATNTGPNRNAKYMAIIAAVAIAAIVVMVFGVFARQGMVKNTGDPYNYAELARGHVEHGGMTRLTRRAATLYVETIAMVYRAGLGDSFMVFLQCLMHVGTCLLVFSLGRRLFNARTGLLAGLACALHPMLLRYVPDLHMETMLTFGCTLTLWLAVRFHDRQTWLNGILLGGVGMLTVLTKGVMLPFLGLFGLIMGLAALRRRSAQGVVAVIAMFATMAIILAPWTYRNYQVTGGRFVLLTPGTSDSFLRGYVFTRMEFATLQKPPYEVAENEVNAWFARIAQEAGTVWDRDEVVDEINNKAVAKHLILTEPLDTARKVFVGLFTFWYEMTSLKTSLVPAVLAVGGWAFAFVGLKRARREGRPSWLIWLPIVVMNVFVAALIPLGRYSVPILPCLMILAAFGLDTLLDRRGIRFATGK